MRGNKRDFDFSTKSQNAEDLPDPLQGFTQRSKTNRPRISQRGRFCIFSDSCLFAEDQAAVWINGLFGLNSCVGGKASCNCRQYDQTQKDAAQKACVSFYSGIHVLSSPILDLQTHRLIPQPTHMS
jgi:hypothetical protein